jgi:hypothetical protein
MIDLNRAWDDPSTRPLLVDATDDAPMTSSLYAYPTLNCPSGTSQRHSDGEPFTDYVSLAGVGKDGPDLPRISTRAGAWAYETVTTIKDVADGLGNTIFMMETAKDNGCWLAGGPATVRPFEPNTPPPIGSKGQFGGIHPGGGMALLMGGEVRLYSNDMEPKVFAALTTIAGGD